MHIYAKYRDLIFVRRPGNRLSPFFVTGPLLLLCLLILQATPAKSSAAPPFFGVALEGCPLTQERLQEVEEEIGLQPDLIVFFLQWPAPGDPGAGVFPGESLQAVWDRGAVPCLTWEPMYFEDGHERAVPWRQILEGCFDPYLISFAEQARAWGRPFIIRPAHEMNLDRYHWGTTKDAYGPESPMIYKRMFRYIVEIFHKAGAHNVLWAFCPNSESVPNPLYDPEASWNSAKNYYPGDEYVDILGMDGYNWGTTQSLEQNGWDSHWRGFREIFGPIYRELRRLSPEKPIFVFETSTVHEGGERRSWIMEAAETMKAWRTKGIAWFHVDKEQDWRLEPEEAGLLGMKHTSLTGCPTAQEWIQERIKWTGRR